MKLGEAEYGTLLTVPGASFSKKGMVETGDIVVLTAGIPSTVIPKSRDGVSNMMRIVTIE